MRPSRGAQLPLVQSNLVGTPGSMRSRNRPIVTIAVLAISLATVAGAEVLLGTHAVRGHVESVTPPALVIRRSTMARTEMRFVLNASTEREGRLVVGDPVS